MSTVVGPLAMATRFLAQTFTFWTTSCGLGLLSTFWHQKSWMFRWPSSMSTDMIPFTAVQHRSSDAGFTSMGVGTSTWTPGLRSKLRLPSRPSGPPTLHLSALTLIGLGIALATSLITLRPSIWVTNRSGDDPLPRVSAGAKTLHMRCKCTQSFLRLFFLQIFFLVCEDAT